MPSTNTIVMDDSSLPDLIEPRKLYIRITFPLPNNLLLLAPHRPYPYVEILPRHTIADVRALMVEFLGQDQDYFFCYYDIRVMKKQEVQKHVWALATPEAMHHARAIANGTVVSIHRR